MIAAARVGPTNEPALNIPPRTDRALALIAIGTCSVIQDSLANPNTADPAPTRNTPAPSMNRLKAKRLGKIPIAPVAAARIMAFLSPKKSINLAAGRSATRRPIISSPVIRPAVARSSVNRNTVAGMLGTIPNSAVEKRKEGR